MREQGGMLPQVVHLVRGWEGSKPKATPGAKRRGCVDCLESLSKSLILFNLAIHGIHGNAVIHKEKSWMKN
jgi:hypothetical protein